MNEEQRQKMNNQFFGALAVVKMCRLAAAYHAEHGEVDISYMPEALELADETLSLFGRDFIDLLLCQGGRPNEGK